MGPVEKNWLERWDFRKVFPMPWRQKKLQSEVVCITVKGHVTNADVKRGWVTGEDKFGGDQADKLARSGAAAHAAPTSVTCLASSRLPLPI